jgi:hypothetical protein
VSQAAFDFQPPRRKKPFNLHRFLRDSKIVIVEVLSAIVFIVWIFRAFLQEILRH